MVNTMMYDGGGGGKSGGGSSVKSPKVRAIENKSNTGNTGVGSNNPNTTRTTSSKKLDLIEKTFENTTSRGVNALNKTLSTVGTGLKEVPNNFTKPVFKIGNSTYINILSSSANIISQRKACSDSTLKIRNQNEVLSSNNKTISSEKKDVGWFDVDRAVEILTGVSKEDHYNRNQYNKQDFPLYYNKEKDTMPGGYFYGWQMDVASDCHQYSSPDNSNIKLVSPDGHYEVIYDKTGKLVTDIRDIGTYNFSPPSEGWNHLVKDIFTWAVWGNSEEDNSGMWRRLMGAVSAKFSSILKNNLIDWGDTSESQVLWT